MADSNLLVRYQNLTDIFKYGENLDAKVIRFIDTQNRENLITYSELYDLSCKMLYHLQEEYGLKQDSKLIFQLDDNYDFIVTFWACLLGGIIPVPITTGHNDEHRLKLISIWKFLEKPKIIGSEDSYENLTKYFKNTEDGLEIILPLKKHFIFTSCLEKNINKYGTIFDPLPSDLAFIQFSSGSTGDPKGVMLTHKNLLVNINSIIQTTRPTDNDSYLNWMPLTHDMGIIGWHLVPTFVTCDQNIMDTNLFVRHPLVWMHKVNEHQATILASPNFGFRHFLKQYKPDKHQEWDLSHVRLIFNGAEPISTDLTNEFLAEMSKYGLKRISMLPAYGMAEASLVVSLDNIDTEFKSIYLNRNSLSVGEVVEEVEKNDVNGIALVELGQPLIDVYLRICDAHNRELPEGTVGFVQIRGENVTQGYYKNPAATSKVMTEDRWLNTGDLGFLRDGRLFFTGRAKDIIFVNGQNYYPSDLEEVALELQGIELNKIVFCGFTDHQDQREIILACVLFRKNLDSFIPLAIELKEFILSKIGIEITYVIPVKQILRTTSGKLQRYKFVQSYMDGEYKQVIDEVESRIIEVLSSRKIEEPTTKNEKIVTHLVSKVLDTDRIGIGDNLIHLGLNSLKAASLIFAVEEAFDVLIPLRKLFTAPTVKEIAVYIDSLEKSANPSIQRLSQEAYYSVSAAQKRVFAANQIGVDHTGYNLPFMITIEGKIDIKRLTQVFNTLIERHESLRTSFEIMGEEPVQKIWEEVYFNLPYYQISKNELERTVRDFVQPFDLSKAPLFKACLLQLGSKHILICDVHHIIADASSIEIFIKEMFLLYSGGVLPELKVQYKDFASWQTRFFMREDYQRMEKYWLQVFADEIPILNLPIDYSRPTLRSYRGDRYKFSLDAELFADLNHLANEHNLTIYMLLYALMSTVLARCTGQEDLILGVSVPGRSHPDVLDLFGMFVNILAVRNKPEGRKTFREFLLEIKEILLTAYENQDYQFDTLVERLNIPGTLERSPLVDAVLVMQNVDRSLKTTGDVQFVQGEYVKQASVFDVTFNAFLDGLTISFDWEYSTDIFSEETIARMANYLITTIGEVIKNPEITLSKIEMLSSEEKNILINEFNNTRIEFDSDKTIQQVFEEQVLKSPDRTAVSDGTETLTYAQLNQRANSVAKGLRTKGVSPDTIIGLVFERSVDMIVGIIGVLKSGGAYLPIAIDYPRERIKFMLENSNSKILLSQKKLVENLQFAEVETLIIEDIYSNDFHFNDQHNPELINSSHDLAYIIYTSGSTGNPKGVMIEHRSVLSLITGLEQTIYYQYNKPLNIALVAPYVFDASVQQIFGSLLPGHTLYIVPEETRKNGADLFEFYNKYQIEVSDLTPTHISQMNMVFNSEITEIPVKHFIVGGEVLYQKEVKNFWELIKDQPKIHNVYGPTECCVDSTAYLINPLELTDSGTVTIGSPLANERIYILGRNLEMLPVGAVGEIFISGAGMARGYLSNPELTEERFVTNPYEPGEKMYKTGDLARRLRDGNIEFIGRADYQVKIRGFRIELGEVEARLVGHQAVTKAVVVAKIGADGFKYLCAYVVFDRLIEATELKDYLTAELPEYMIPSVFVQITELPLTPSGKIDRRALPEPELESKVTFVKTAPVDYVEARMIELWEDVLSVEKVGVEDDFFEHGGHSLNATVLVSKINKEFNVKFPLREVFKRRILKEVAAVVRELERKEFYAIRQVPEQEYYQVSSAQKRLYVISEAQNYSIYYNAPVIKIINGELDLERLTGVFKEIVRRHDSLRTSFDVIDDVIVQRVHQEVRFEVGFSEIEKDEVIKTIEGFVRPFDLQQAPLFRVEIAKFEASYLFMLDIHHIISDAISMEIIFSEIDQLYQGNPLSELTIQYKDFAFWQNQALNSERIKEQERYWVERFTGEIPILKMSTDFARPAVLSYEGDQVEFALNQDIFTELKSISKANEATLFMTLLTGFNILLAKYTGQDDIIVGTPIAGRQHADLSGIVGCFVNMLPLRNSLFVDKTYTQTLNDVKENALKAYENQDYQFELLVEKLGLERQSGRNPLFDIVFALQNTGDVYLYSDTDIITPQSKLVFEPVKVKHTISKFDITIVAYEDDGKLNFKLEYCTQLFKPAAMERFAGHLINLFRQIVANPELTLSQLDILSESERTQILHSFNDTQVFYAKEKTIIDLFEEQVFKTSEEFAVCAGSELLTYEELDQASNRVADLLRDRGVGRDQVVGLLTDRSIEMIVGIMGILKAGGAYLPIGLEYPKARIEYLLKDSQSKLLLHSDSQYVDQLDIEIERLGFSTKSLRITEKTLIDKVNKPTDLAYVIYTSGSTGTPKGVMVEHRNMINLLVGLQENIYSRYGSGLKVALVAPYIFDASVQQIFAALLFGHCLYIVPEDIRRDGEGLVEFYHEYDICISDGTPMHLSLIAKASLIVDDLPVKHFIIGGDSLYQDNVRHFLDKFRDYQPLITNIYGPTECCVDSTAYLFKMEDEFETVPIGRPLSNLQIYILSTNFEVLPVGVIGEIYISGDSVARGYLANSELTLERFIPDPFRSGQRMYKTGDLGRWLSDGNIEFVGRADYQVKVRGYRIEPGEIETRLFKYSGIQQVAVTDQTDSQGVKYLTAYLVHSGDITEEELRGYLALELPDYMIPAHFIFLNEMPLKSNGKIDRQALLGLTLGVEAISDEGKPKNLTEEKMMAIWKDVLDLTRVSRDCDFFEVGGHSLNATLLVSRVNKEFEVKFPLREVFKRRTLKEMVRYIKEAEIKAYSAIAKIEDREFYPVSAAQKRVYTLTRFDKGGIAYNAPIVMEMKGTPDITTFEEAFNGLIRLHESLRTSFYLQGGEIVQKIHQDVDFTLEYLAAAETELKVVIQKFIRPFDLSQAPLLRAGITKTQDKTLFMLDMHHIISDGVSMDIMLRDLFDLYQGKELIPGPVQYKDFTIWQNKFLESPIIKEQEEYWLNSFTGDLPTLNLPTDFPWPSVMTFAGDNLKFVLDQKLFEALKRLTRKEDVTLFMTLLASFNVLMAKYSGQDDIIIGTPVAGRRHAELERIVGSFINTLALRNQPASEKTFRAFLSEVKENAISAFENQDYQFDMLVDKLGLERNMSRNPLFDVMCVLQNANDFSIYTRNLTNFGTDNLRIFNYDYEYPISKFSLVLVAYEIENELHFRLDYSTALFKRETIVKMIEYFINLLKAVVQYPEIGLANIRLISGEERKRLLYDFNQTKVQYPLTKTVHRLFEEQVLKTPKQIAAISEDTSITYYELNEKANQLARKLKVKGVKSEQIVGVMVHASIEALIGIFAVLKAGGAYLPIDPDYPVARIDYILQDSDTQLLLTQNSFRSKLLSDCAVLYLDDAKLYTGDGTNLSTVYSSTNLIYVIYTSGSTGRPKGTLIEHQAVVNYLIWAKRVYLQGERCDFPLYSSLAFDLTVTSIYLPLLSASKIIIYTSDKREMLIGKIISEDRVDIIKLTPAHLKVMAGLELAASKVKKLIVGGEALKTDLAAEIYQKFGGEIEIYNEYGPTETVVGCMIYRYQPEKDRGLTVPIGIPADNAQIYLLDSTLEPVGVGLPGEIYIAGDGVGRGYLNQPELTEERFIGNPFIEGWRMYRTGDSGRMLSDGNIEFLGRLDQQIKLRGYRIELAEIEEQLRSYEGIKEAVVIDERDTAGEIYLSGYVIGEGEYLSIEEIRKYLLARLPEYMIPGEIIEIEKIPLTINGKLDRQALMELKKSVGEEKELPRTEVEAKLLAIWEEVLGRELGIADNFFAHGGQSIKATQLIARINQRMNVELSLMEVFMRPTVAEMAAVIEELQESLYESIEPIPEAEYYQVSAAQQRIYTLAMMDKDGISYNAPVVLEIDELIDILRLESAFKALVTRHEALRTGFTMVEDKVVQKILPEVDFAIEFIEVEESAVKEIINTFIRPFDLENAPLLRVGVVRTPERMLLMLDIHHIIADAVSMKVIFTELNALYEGIDLEPLEIHYKDFAVWQNELFLSDKLKNQEEYWLEEFTGEIPILNLPTDFKRPAVMSFEGDSIYFALDKELTIELNQFTIEREMTLFMTLFAVFNILLAKYSAQEDIIIGTPTAGRRHADLENIIGMFVNTLALRNYPVMKKTCEEFLDEVKESSLKAFDNQDYQFDMLIEKLELKRDTAHTPLFDVMFAFQNATDVQGYLEESGLKFIPYDFEYKIAKFNLVLVAYEMDDRIHFKFDYSTALFKRTTVEIMGRYFVNILRSLIANPNTVLQDIQLITEEERTKLIYEFNATESEYPEERTIQQLFAEQVDQTPDCLAVVNDREVTYKELDVLSDQLARMLVVKGVKEESIVGIMADHSIELIVGILGILKANGAFLPIDPDYPEKRIKYLLTDSGCKVLLTQSHLLDGITEYVENHMGEDRPGKDSAEDNFTGEVICLDNLEKSITGEGELTGGCGPENLAYVIYTSGSTGLPKGTLVQQRGVVNYITWAKKVYLEGEQISVPLYSSIAFDLTITSIFVPLLSGNRIVIYDAKDKGGVITKIIEEDRVDLIKLTPAHLKIIQELDVQNSRLKTLIVGGENLGTELANRIYHKFAGNLRIYNEYGPTETVVGCMIHRYNPELDNGSSVPIGKPADNVAIYLLDANLEPVGIGIPGELYISGDGVSRGYLNQPELTEERFTGNPFIEGWRMYRTGDSGRMLSDGNIEFLGRLDQQIKLRGYRIELAEIEEQLRSYEGIKEAVVIDERDTAGEIYLSGYVIGEGEYLSIEEIRKYLLARLPEYMIPGEIIEIEKIPLTINGKLDRQALMELKKSVGEEKELPRTEVEAKLLAIWEEVLGRELGIADNFFAHGGQSIKATQLIARINQRMNVELSLMEVFMRPTVAEMAAVIEELQESLYESIEPIPEAEYYQVSAAQRRIYSLTMFDRNSIIYNVPVVLEIGNSFNLARLENAFKEMIKRHEAFRTSFTIIDGNLVQQVLSEVDFAIESIEAEELTVEEIINKFIRPFDFEQAPLLRVGVIRTSERTLLIFDVHHIITDAVSIKVIYTELSAFYAGEDLEPLNVQYKDFAAWQNGLLQSAEIKDQEEYWLNKFAGEIPVLNLPTDFIRPSVPDLTGDLVKFVLDRQLTTELKEFGAKKEVTLFMSLLASFNILLAKYSNNEDVIVGTPIAGRRHVDLENIIGIFINTLALRNYPESNKTFEEFLAEVKQSSVEAFDNQDYQFDTLVDKLVLKRDLGHSPLFDVMFALQNATDEIEYNEESELNLKPYNFEYKTAIYDLVLVAFEMNNQLHFRLEYSTDLFKHDTIMTMAQCYINIIHEVLKNPQIYLQDIALISEDYRDELIYQFNKTEVKYCKDRTIQQLFTEQVISNPTAPALCAEGITLTYEELDEKTNQLACLLKEKGVGSNQIVGLFTDRSVEMVIGILGVLKAGGAYLPLDLVYPVSRIEFMLKDSSCKLLLHTDRELSIRLSSDLGIEFIHLESEALLYTKEEELENLSKPTDLAYVIYTSGSTGNPKGVMIEHRNVLNLMVGLKANIYTYHGSGLNVALVAPYIFDASVQQIFAALLFGHCLFIVPEEIRKDGTELVEFYRQYNIQISDGTPTHLRMISEALNNDTSSLEKGLPVERFIIGGDVLYQDSVRDFMSRFKAVKPLVTNVYGPTECSVDAAAYDFNPLDESSTVSLGRPLSNVQIYILDKALKPVPIGVVGAIYISGDGLARGYLANQELTAERFMLNPFIPGERMYSTGDLGRWLTTGNIEFIGRSDYQVKIRGFRIELGEIEAKLLKHPGVKQAVVTDKVDRQGIKYLVLYYVSAETVAEEELRNYLALKLPEYMIPTYFVELTELPLKSNGKIDHQALKDLVLEVETTQSAEPPKNSTEEKLVEIWREVFDEAVLIHRNSDFFELGGHSLNAVLMVSRVTKEFGIKLSLREVFKRRTLQDIAEYISDAVALEPELGDNVNQRTETKIDEIEEEFDF